jgi:hypothetical protein
LKLARHALIHDGPISRRPLRATPEAGPPGRVDRRPEGRLSGYDPDELVGALDGPGRLAFWGNVYNAYSQVLVDGGRDLYEESRRRFFGLEAIPVAGRELILTRVGNYRSDRPQSGGRYGNTLH